MSAMMVSAAFPIDLSIRVFTFRLLVSKLYATGQLAFLGASDAFLFVFERDGSLCS